MVAAIRIFGKTQLSQLNAGDIVLLLLISNAVQNAMVGPDTSLQGGLLAALILFLANFLLKKYLFRNQKVKSFLESDPVILVKDGILDNVALKKEDITLDELEETIREHGVEKLEEIRLAILEVDGNISVVSADSSSHFTNFSRHKRKYPKKAYRY